MNGVIAALLYVISVLLVGLYGLTSIAAATEPAIPKATPEDQAWHLPPPPKLNDATVKLGNQLFFDPRILGNQKMSCADCHHPGFSWSSAEAFDAQNISAEQSMLNRQTPSLLYVYGYAHFFWDGRVDTSLTAAINRHMEILAGDVHYRSQSFEWTYDKLFKAAFGQESEISRFQIASALSDYIRSLSTNNSAFDDWLAGKTTNFSASALRGFRLFTGRAGCARCHQAPYFSDSGIHNIGLKSLDPGYYEISRRAQHNNAFRTTMLRQVSRTMPYMHNGSLARLSDVVAFYNRGGMLKGGGNELKPLHLTPQEQEDLVAFLRSLESVDPPATIPMLPITAQ